jgi:hypothetical protein
VIEQPVVAVADPGVSFARYLRSTIFTLPPIYILSAPKTLINADTDPPTPGSSYAEICQGVFGAMRR